MNGWKNYETWNVVLWVANDERLYRLASECRSYAEFRERVGSNETLDGVSWHDPNLDLPAIDEWWNDTFPMPCRKLATSIEEFGIPKGGFWTPVSFRGLTMGLDTFTLSYLETALWASADDNGRPLEDKYGIDDIAPESLKIIVNDCKAFQEDNESLLTIRHLMKRGCPLSQGGQDFFLTRNGHGAGFWDGDWKESAGKILTQSSKIYGSQDLYVGDDGKLYVA